MSEILILGGPGFIGGRHVDHFLSLENLIL
jgi:hypothetical protein